MSARRGRRGGLCEARWEERCAIREFFLTNARMLDLLVKLPSFSWV
jgi:hypothetical protein